MQRTNCKLQADFPLLQGLVPQSPHCSKVNHIRAVMTEKYSYSKTVLHLLICTTCLAKSWKTTTLPWSTVHIVHTSHFAERPSLPFPLRKLPKMWTCSMHHLLQTRLCCTKACLARTAQPTHHFTPSHLAKSNPPLLLQNCGLLQNNMIRCYQKTKRTVKFNEGT